MESGEATRIVARAREIMRAGLPAGLTAAATGPAASRADAADANGRVDGTLTLVTVAVVALLLLVTYRSPVLPLVPLACVAAGVVAAQAGAVLVAEAGVVVNGSGAALMIVLVFGLGTDYALLLISRYREELAEHSDRHQAMALALRRTAPSVAASAATMALAALALFAADMNSTKGLGPLAAIAVVAALLAMTTLLPALLTALGRGVFWPAVPRRAAPGARTAHIWRWTGRLVSGRPRRAWAVAGLTLAALACGTAFLRVGVLDGGDNFTRVPESAAGQEVVRAHYPGGATAPVLVYVPARAAATAAGLARTAPGLAASGPAETSASGRWTRITAVLADPPSSDPARRSVEGLRARLARAVPDALVGGQTAALLDRDAAMDRDLAVIVPLVTGVVTLVLGVLLRAAVAPLLLLGCALLSSGAALGLSALLFHALGFARTDQTVLTLGFLFLVALGVDYTIFLMARARQEVRERGHRDGVVTALVATGGVITGSRRRARRDVPGAHHHPGGPQHPARSAGRARRARGRVRGAHGPGPRPGARHRPGDLVARPSRARAAPVRSALGDRQPALVGEHDELGAVPCAQFRHGPAHVGAYGGGADHQAGPRSRRWTGRRRPTPPPRVRAR